MKFRSKLVDIGCIHQLTRVLSVVSKIMKTSTLILSETQVVFTQNERATGGGTSMWCELNQVDYFEDFRIEGKDDTNQIYLEIINENLLRALKSGQNAQTIKMKLTKKQTPCLTFEVSLPSMTSHSRVVVHDVPVAVIPSRFWENFQKPVLPAYDIKISLPNLKVLKNIIERMKNISGFMVLSASSTGELCCKVETDEVTATTHFNNMEVLDSGALEQEDEKIEARIDVQKLVTFLNVQQFNPNKEDLLASQKIKEKIHPQMKHVLPGNDGRTKPTSSQSNDGAPRIKRRKRVGKNAVRERTRVQQLKKAFSDLQKVLPDVPEDTKLSRLDILLLAINYLSQLMKTLSQQKDEVHLRSGQENSATPTSKESITPFQPPLYVAHSQWLYRSSLKIRKSTQNSDTNSITSPRITTNIDVINFDEDKHRGKKS